MSYGRRYYGEDDDVREKTVPRAPGYRPEWVSIDEQMRALGFGDTVPASGPDCCVCGMPMRDEKPCHWIGDDPMHKDCVGPGIRGVRKA